MSKIETLPDGRQVLWYERPERFVLTLTPAPDPRDERIADLERALFVVLALACLDNGPSLAARLQEAGHIAASVLGEACEPERSMVATAEEWNV